MKFWWVNQNQTYKFEVPGGFLWSPKTRSDGARNYFYETMTLVEPGDLVFSYCDTYIKAIGIVQQIAETSPKPDFDSIGNYWSNVGWLVRVEFEEIKNPIKPKEFINLIRPFLSDKYAPLSKDGNGLQIVYLTEISSELAKILLDLSNENLSFIENKLAPLVENEVDNEIQNEIKFHGIENDLEKIQLVKSRRGQGIFKTRVRLIEKRCRVTGIETIRHLRASHIKPWSKSNEIEKIDGHNGLLLSPHIDHLFDQGFISFKSNGELILSNELGMEIIEKWKITKDLNSGNFNSNQSNYLEFHRDVVLR